MQVSEIFDTVTGFVALGGAVGVVLLIPLYFSQRRDVRRLRDWVGARARLRRDGLRRRASSASTTPRPSSRSILGEGPAPTEQPTEIRPPATGETPIPAATRVTHDRPALERITMERAALAPHPRWRRFVESATQPRVLVAIGVVALLLGAGAIFASQQLLSDDAGPQRPARRQRSTRPMSPSRC